MIPPEWQVCAPDQHLLVRVLQSLGGIKPELAGEVEASALIDSGRVVAPTGHVQRANQQRRQPLPAGVGKRKLREQVDCLSRSTTVQFDLGELLRRRYSQIVHPRSDWVERLGRQVRQRGAAPQGQGPCQ